MLKVWFQIALLRLDLRRARRAVDRLALEVHRGV